mmetsp:Transcript_124020/g.312279  ORF Transcript_124020/g.312279 Transcript_124020/m.312279 type:complete len:211 (+) Transcript_124020:64-696(+)
MDRPHGPQRAPVHHREVNDNQEEALDKEIFGSSGSLQASTSYTNRQHSDDHAHEEAREDFRTQHVQQDIIPPGVLVCNPLLQQLQVERLTMQGRQHHARLTVLGDLRRHVIPSLLVEPQHDGHRRSFLQLAPTVVVADRLLAPRREVPHRRPHQDCALAGVVLLEHPPANNRQEVVNQLPSRQVAIFFPAFDCDLNLEDAFREVLRHRRL